MQTFKEFLAESTDTVHFSDEHGELAYGWNSELEDEEFKGYIPKGYKKKVLELNGIFAAELGKGNGDFLMKKFMDSPQFKAAELVFLDPVPGMGEFYGSKRTHEQQITSLMKFYRKYGFRNNPKGQRMWIVRKGELADDKLPS